MHRILISGNVNDQHLLSAQVPDSVPTGPVTVMILSQEADAEQAWMAGIAREWADELGDERHDIYTLDDGESVNGDAVAFAQPVQMGQSLTDDSKPVSL